MPQSEVATTISLTESAAAQVRRLIEDRATAGQALRVFVAGSGCSGMRYGMALDPHPRPDDIKGHSNGVDLLIDPVSIGYLDGSKIDYIDDPAGGSFRIDNPNAAAACGCGQASSDEDGEAAGCNSPGCGGGCC